MSEGREKVAPAGAPLREHPTPLELALMGIEPGATARAQANQLAAAAPLHDRDRGVALVAVDPELVNRCTAYANELDSAVQLAWVGVEYGPEAAESNREAAADIRALAALFGPIPEEAS